jgi:hypothetical protein
MTRIRKSEEGRSSFSEEKETKRLLRIGCRARQRGKVFCFFFSKKQAFLTAPSHADA